MLLPVLADIQALHDPHVGVIDEAVTRRRWRTDTAAIAAAQDRALAGKVIDGDQPAEVANRRRLVARDVVVDVQQLALDFKATPRDRLGVGAAGILSERTVPATRRETGEDEPRGGLDGSAARERAVPEVVVTVISRPRVASGTNRRHPER